MPDVNKIVSPKISLEKGGFIKRANPLMKKKLTFKQIRVYECRCPIHNVEI